jgi:MraZ protein
MFLGSFNIKFTGLGRIVLPKKIRQEFGDRQRVILSKGLEECIWGWSLNNWEKETGKYLDTPIIDKQSRDIKRFLFSGAEEVTWDVQGRIIIPSALLSHARLTSSKEVILVGVGDHIEIWEPGKWKKVLGEIKI